VQAEALREALCGKDVPAKVYVGMRYWHPFTEEAIEQVGAWHIPKILLCSVDFSGFFFIILERNSTCKFPLFFSNASHKINQVH